MRAFSQGAISADLASLIIIHVKGGSLEMNFMALQIAASSATFDVDIWSSLNLGSAHLWDHEGYTV